MLPALNQAHSVTALITLGRSLCAFVFHSLHEGWYSIAILHLHRVSRAQCSVLLYFPYPNHHEAIDSIIILLSAAAVHSAQSKMLFDLMHEPCRSYVHGFRLARLVSSILNKSYNGSRAMQYSEVSVHIRCNKYICLYMAHI